MVARGDSRGQRELYERFAGYLSAVARRYLGDEDTVKDVLQDAFVRIFQKFESFRYRGEGSLKAWVTRIVVNGALHELRSDKHMLTVETLPETEPDVEPEIDNVPAVELQKMIRNLPDGYRTVFNLYVFEQMSHKEIASLLGIKEDSSASQLLRAKARLAHEIKEYRRKHDR